MPPPARWSPPATDTRSSWRRGDASEASRFIAARIEAIVWEPRPAHSRPEPIPSGIAFGFGARKQAMSVDRKKAIQSLTSIMHQWLQLLVGLSP